MKLTECKLFLIIIFSFFSCFVFSQNINENRKQIMLSLSLDETMISIHRKDYDLEFICNKKINDKICLRFYLVSVKTDNIVSLAFQVDNQDNYSLLKDLIRQNGILKGFETYAYGFNYVGFLDASQMDISNKLFPFVIEGLTPELITELKKIITLKKDDFYIKKSNGTR